MRSDKAVIFSPDDIKRKVTHLQFVSDGRSSQVKVTPTVFTYCVSSKSPAFKNLLKLRKKRNFTYQKYLLSTYYVIIITYLNTILLLQLVKMNL